ncbi:MAG: hypothetical protein H8D46_04835 [FCB group bacterium]|nr:hypothetical protein [FCB group bacterium]
MQRLLFLLLVLSAGIFTLAQHEVPASQKQDPARIFRIDSQHINPNTRHGLPGPIPNFQNRNEFQVSLIDSSKNGYGLVLPSTRPLWVGEEGWLLAYRKWEGPGGSSGILGAAQSPDGIDWGFQNIINSGLVGGRYPSTLGTANYPYVFYNDFDPLEFGSRAAYSVDEFGWFGGSWGDPILLDPITGLHDLWTISPDVSWSETEQLYYFNLVADDWTGGAIYANHSEWIEDDLVIFAGWTEIFPPLDGNPDGVSYTSAPVLDINENGTGYAAVSSYIPEVATHTLVFRQTQDYGATWSEFGENNYYAVLDNVFQSMVDDGIFLSIYTDDCDGSSIEFDGVFCTYEFDLRVDSEGNPHFIVGIILAGGEGVYPGMFTNAFMHLWIDHEYLENPGNPNTATGWNYSKVLDAQSMWRWDNEDGESYWHSVFPSLAISEENDDVMWVVISGPDPGEFVVTDDGGTPDDTCDDLGEYPAWNEEIFVIKSEDGGLGWWCPYNATDTPMDCWIDENLDYICAEDMVCPDIETLSRPDEVNAHAGTGAADDRANLVFQSPDWCYGSTTGDMSAQNHKNWIFSGWIELTEEECDGQYYDYPCGDVNCDDIVNVQDIVMLVNAYLFNAPLCPDADLDCWMGSFNPILMIVHVVDIIMSEE